MRISKNKKDIIGTGISILVWNLIFPQDWGIALFSAAVFIIGGLTLPTLFRFMTNNKQDKLYK